MSENNRIEMVRLFKKMKSQKKVIEVMAAVNFGSSQVVKLKEGHLKCAWKENLEKN